MIHERATVEFRETIFCADDIKTAATHFKAATQEASSTTVTLMAGGHDEAVKFALLLALVGGVTPIVVEPRQLSTVIDALGPLTVILPQSAPAPQNTSPCFDTLLSCWGLTAAVSKRTQCRANSQFTEDLKAAAYGFMTSGSASASAPCTRIAIRTETVPRLGKHSCYPSFA